MRIAEQLLTDVGGPPMVGADTAAELHQLIIMITMVVVIIPTNHDTGCFLSDPCAHGVRSLGSNVTTRTL